MTELLFLDGVFVFVLLINFLFLGVETGGSLISCCWMKTRRFTSHHQPKKLGPLEIYRVINFRHENRLDTKNVYMLMQ